MRRPCSWAGAVAAFLLLALATPVDALDSAGVTLNSTYNIVSLHTHQQQAMPKAAPSALPPLPAPGHTASGCRMSHLAPPAAQVAIPESCSYVRKRFGSPILDYQASWRSNATVPPYCTLE